MPSSEAVDAGKTPDRTSSEDEPQRDNANVEGPVGLPPMVPVKLAAKCSLQSDGIAAPKEVDAVQESGKPVKKPTKDVKRTKLKAGKKVAAKPERRRKRKTEAGISQASAKMLFQCSCQLLRTQVLDYDVRAREVEERNATQAKEIEQWERRIRSLQRELEEYDSRERDEAEGAMINAEGERQEPPAEASVADAAHPEVTLDSSLPPAVLAAEEKLHEEMRKRRQMEDEFCRSVPGFIDSLGERR